MMLQRFIKDSYFTTVVSCHHIKLSRLDSIRLGLMFIVASLPLSRSIVHELITAVFVIIHVHCIQMRGRVREIMEECNASDWRQPILLLTGQLGESKLN